PMGPLRRKSDGKVLVEDLLEDWENRALQGGTCNNPPFRSNLDIQYDEILQAWISALGELQDGMNEKDTTEIDVSTRLSRFLVPDVLDELKSMEGDLPPIQEGASKAAIAKLTQLMFDFLPSSVADFAIFEELEKAVSTVFLVIVIALFALMIRFRGNSFKRAEEFFGIEREISDCSTYADSTAESVCDLDF
ncbi:hypothetical protein FOL47_001369, partial [Perkinsus chesapeaki]